MSASADPHFTAGQIRTDAAKLTNVRITRFRQCRDLVSEMFIKDKAKIACRVSSINRSVLYSSELLSVTNEERFRFRRVESQEIGSQL